jgi:hypothetical protein
VGQGSTGVKQRDLRVRLAQRGWQANDFGPRSRVSPGATPGASTIER